jgi:hypothetical protein
MNERAGPFLLRYAGTLPSVSPSPLVYDPGNQVSRVRTDRGWIIGLEAGTNDPPRTITTLVRAETTDDN